MLNLFQRLLQGLRCQLRIPRTHQPFHDLNLSCGRGGHTKVLTPHFGTQRLLEHLLQEKEASFSAKIAADARTNGHWAYVHHPYQKNVVVFSQIRMVTQVHPLLLPKKAKNADYARRRRKNTLIIVVQLFQHPACHGKADAFVRIVHVSIQHTENRIHRH